jgi:hypothetical protein
MKLSLILDDSKDFYEPNDIIVRSAEAFVDLWWSIPRPHKIFGEIYLDHDLGKGRNGMYVLRILEEYLVTVKNVFTRDPIPTIYIITQNVVEAPRMQEIADKINAL